MKKPHDRLKTTGSKHLLSNRPYHKNIDNKIINRLSNFVIEKKCTVKAYREEIGTGPATVITFALPAKPIQIMFFKYLLKNNYLLKNTWKLCKIWVLIDVGKKWIQAEPLPSTTLCPCNSYLRLQHYVSKIEANLKKISHFIFFDVSENHKVFWIITPSYFTLIASWQSGSPLHSGAIVLGLANFSLSIPCFSTGMIALHKPFFLGCFHNQSTTLSLHTKKRVECLETV